MDNVVEESADDGPLRRLADNLVRERHCTLATLGWQDILVLTYIADDGLHAIEQLRFEETKRPAAL